MNQSNCVAYITLVKAKFIYTDTTKAKVLNLISDIKCTSDNKSNFMEINTV